MRSGRFGVARAQRGAAAEEREIHARKIESGDIGRARIGRERPTEIALLVERVQFGARKFPGIQLLDQRLAYQARRADHGNPRRRAAAEPVMRRSA